ncbi:hypothetical protein J7L48_06915 [bacterium]|nr:hypothetical protein [bacterium]
MKIEDFKNNLLNEIEEKWNKEMKILENTYEIKRKKLRERYDKIIAEQKILVEQKLSEVKDSKVFMEKRSELDIISQLSTLFTDELYNDLLDWIYSSAGNEFIEKKIGEIKKKFEVSNILIGKKNLIKGYDKGNFQSGFKAVLKNENEIDLSDAYLNVFVKDKIYEVINDEIFGNR